LAWAGLGLSLTVPAADITVSGPLYGIHRWYSTNVYHLRRFVYVMEGAELHIEPGTVIKGLPGQDAETAALIVTRGGKIFAEGTREKPIIFTAEAEDVDDPESLPLYERGLWGGVVLMGRAPINTAIDTAGNSASPKYDVFEGLPDLQIGGQYVHRFGGNDPHDSSGVLRYVSIRRAGMVFLPNKELNGMSLCAVGDGTVVEFVESFAAADDGFEFFGGTVNTRYLISAFNDDDAFDTDQGHNGKHQFWFAIQEPGKKDNGAELNGEPNESNAGNPPVANFQVWNATWIGAGTNTSGNRGFMIRVYAAPRIYNSIITDFGGPAITIPDHKAGQHATNGLMDIRENLWYGFRVSPIWDGIDGGFYSAIFFQDTSRSNYILEPQLRGISRGANGGLDPRPRPGSPAWGPSSLVPPNDGFFEPVRYRGAFGEWNWAAGWSFLWRSGVLTSEGMNVEMPPAAVRLTGVRQGNALLIEFPGESGVRYQLEASDSLVGGTWEAVGEPVIGAGTTVSLTVPLDAQSRFYRVSARR
jgi:hypothetical protein